MGRILLSKNSLSPGRGGSCPRARDDDNSTNARPGRSVIARISSSSRQRAVRPELQEVERSSNSRAVFHRTAYSGMILSSNRFTLHTGGGKWARGGEPLWRRSF